MKTRKKKRPVQTVGARLSSLLSFPVGSERDVPYLELQGDRSLAITGYEALLLYEERNILFRMRAHADGYRGEDGEGRFTLLRIVGENLTICLLHAGCLSVRGRIDAVILHGDRISVNEEGEGAQ